MLKILARQILFAMIPILFIGCGQKDERKAEGEKSKVEEAVKDVVTKEFKMYEGAKAALEKTEKEAQERREKEKEVK